MGLLDYFIGTRQTTAAIAKERLQILVAHERSERNKPDYLPMLQKELLEVVRKYVNVEPDNISVTMEQDANREVLELNIILPDEGERNKKLKRGG